MYLMFFFYTIDSSVGHVNSSFRHISKFGSRSDNTNVSQNTGSQNATISELCLNNNQSLLFFYLSGEDGKLTAISISHTRLMIRTLRLRHRCWSISEAPAVANVWKIWDYPEQTTIEDLLEESARSIQLQGKNSLGSLIWPDIAFTAISSWNIVEDKKRKTIGDGRDYLESADSEERCSEPECITTFSHYLSILQVTPIFQPIEECIWYIKWWMVDRTVCSYQPRYGI